MDLTTGWNFDTQIDRQRAEEYVTKEKPMLLVSSPMCTAFSQLQRLNAAGLHSTEKMRRAISHMEFVTKLYRLQINAGRLFLHEHPASASSWQLNCIMKIADKENVVISTADLCMYGLRTKSASAGGAEEVFAKKPTKFMTNSARITEELSRRCRGLHAHQRLMGGKRAEAAAKYPPDLCKAICRGLRQEKKERRMGI